MRRRCKDCAPESKRPAPYPGPRCATHYRIYKNNARKTAHERRMQGVYGLEPGEYDALYEYQGGVCAICRRANGATRRLSVDHDHALVERDGLRRSIRGLLCRPCNDLLGHGRDDPEFFQRAIDYLNDPPARRLIYGEREIDEG